MIDAVNENPTIEEQTGHYQKDDLVTRLRKHSHGGMHAIGNEAADEIERLRLALHAIVEMIDHCPDAPRNSDSLPGAIRYYADGALRGIDTGVK